MMKAVLFLALLAITLTAAQTTFSNSGCSDSTGDLVQPDAPAFTGGFLNNAGIGLNFIASNRYSRVQFAFQSTGKNNSYCGFDTDAGSPFWSTTVSTTCDTNSTIAAAWASAPAALGSCYSFDNVTNSQFSLYSATIVVTSTLQRAAIRGESITRTVVTAFRLSFQFQNYINTSTLHTVNISSSANVTSDIISNIFDPLSQSYTVQLETSVQRPYQLTPAAVASQLSGGGDVTSSPTQNSATCLDEAICFQTFTTTFAPPAGNSSGYCLWQPVFTFYFNIVCNDEYLLLYPGTNCTTSATSTFNATFTLTLNDYCVQLVTTISLTGSMHPYNVPPNGPLATLPAPIYNFLAGQNVYYRADIDFAGAVAGLQLIDYTQFLSATITSADGYFTTFLPADGGDEEGPFNYYNNLYGSTSAGFRITLTVSNSVTGSTPYIIQADTTDVAQLASVSATFMVNYQLLPNTTTSLNNRHSLYNSKRVQLKDSVALLDNSVTDTQATSTFESQFSVVRPATATTSTDSLVPAVAASAAGVAMFSVFIAFVLYRRRRSAASKSQTIPPFSKEESTSSTSNA